MVSDDGQVALVFNGEIFNFVELRQILQGEGYHFRSNSDTEALLLAYLRWGKECLKRLDGMFAFAIWDGRSNELLLARDRLGKKPLYYYNRGGEFIFGSEIKAILSALNGTPEIDYDALDDYLTFLYIPYPRTIFSGIRQLPPSTFLSVRFDADSDPVLQSCIYWTPLAPGARLSDRDIIPYLRSLLANSVRKRLVSDVPLGLLLSGGMDSTTILAIMSEALAEPVRSFSITFPDNKHYDESACAELAAQVYHADHHPLVADVNWSASLARIVSHFDQPFGNPTALLSYKLSGLAKKFVTVAMVGDGGDELFGGYPRYVGAYFSRVPRSLPGFLRNRVIPAIGSAMSDDTSGRHQARRVREFLESAGMPFIDMYSRWISYYTPEQKTAIYDHSVAAHLKGRAATSFLKGLYEESEGLEPLNRLSYVDLKSFLCCNVLEYGDRMSMAHALELRAPFTDSTLAHFCLHLPFNRKFRFGECKWILKRAMERSLPRQTLSKQKLGFNPPACEWLRADLRGLCEDLVSEKNLGKRGLFRPGPVQQFLADHLSGRRDNALHLWALMVLELWFQLYVDGRSADSVQESINASVAGARAVGNFRSAAGVSLS